MTRGAAPKRGSDRMTFRPGPGLWFITLLLLGLAYLLLWGLPDAQGDHVLMALGLGAFGLFLPLYAWVRYRLDAEGLERRTISRRDRWAWTELGGVRGGMVNRGVAGVLESSVRLAEGSMRSADVGRRVMRYEICDSGGYVLFRISPWTRKRQHLAAEIRRRAAAARRVVGR